MASFLWRNDDLRRLRTRNLVLQGTDGSYPAEDALLRFVDAEGTVGASGIFVDDSGNLVVTGSADISGGLTVDGSGSIAGALSVGGSADISGDLYVYGLISASGDVISSSGLSRLSTNAPNVGSCAIYSDEADGLGPQFQAYKKRGASGAVIANDELCRINFFGLDTVGTYIPAAAAIRSFAAGNFTGTSHPADIRLATCAVGKTAADDRVIVGANGEVSIFHDSTTATDNKFVRTFNDPCGGHFLSTTDYIVGQNDTDFGGGGPYRDYRYIYGSNIPGGNRPIWGIINDASGGNPGNIEFYQNVSITGNCIVRSLFSVNYAIDASAGASPETASLNTYTNRDIHGYSDKGYSYFEVSNIGPIVTSSTAPITNPIGLSAGLWAVTSVPQGANNENAQPSGVFYWDGSKWTGNAVSYSFTSNILTSAIVPISGGANLQVANNGGVPITVDVYFRQLLSTPV